mmetsp:Transcript_7693/g.11580  ORF Transcript_7693/g.11580 Transcript_7693/m.11580 type:complete len:209 (+) Transcript_7693:24-650(+)
MKRKLEQIENDKNASDKVKKASLVRNFDEILKLGLATCHENISIVHSSTTSEAFRLNLLNLTKVNMKKMYKVSKGVKWSESEKYKELFSKRSRLLIYFDEVHKDIVNGFAHFRFEMDIDNDPLRPILYLYELQIQKTAQRKGIGNKIVHLLITLGKALEMEKIMLTSLKINENANTFYKNFGFELDPSTPSKWGIEVGYEILSYPLTK